MCLWKGVWLVVCRAVGLGVCRGREEAAVVCLTVCKIAVRAGGVQASLSGQALLLDASRLVAVWLAQCPAELSTAIGQLRSVVGGGAAGAT